MNLKDLIKKNQTLDYIQWCVKNIGNKETVRKIIKMKGGDPLEMRPDNYGDLYPDKTILYIDPSHSYIGFFGTLYYTLAALLLAEKRNLEPVIYYGDEYPYREISPINGTNNPFEYYFCSISNIPVDDVFKSRNVLIYKDIHRFMIEILHGCDYECYRFNEYYIQELGKICKKYLNLNKIVKEYIDSSIVKLLNGKKTLGVHFRGGDYKKKYQGHPVSATPKEYIYYAKAAMEEMNYEQIFLATDDDSVLNLFKQEFGNIVKFYTGATRTDKDECVMYSKSTRMNNHYQLGLEVLLDSFTLAYCDGIVCGLSQVSNFARILKSSEGDFSFKKVIDLGIYIEGRKLT